MMAFHAAFSSLWQCLAFAYKMISDCSLAIIQGAPHPVMVANFPAVWANIVPF